MRPVETRVHQIERFHPLSDAATFGKLEFLGGLEIASDDPLFGGLSGLRLIGDRMIAISDAGYWFDGQLERDGGRLTGLRDMRTTPMLDEMGMQFRYKAQIDAEGLERIGNDTETDGWFVAAERDNRVIAFAGDPFGRPTPSLQISYFDDERLRGNRGFEALAIKRLYRGTTGFVVLSEDSDINAGQTLGFAMELSENAWLPVPLGVAKHGNFGITDAAFLPNGDLLILERRFSLASGPAVRIRRIAGETIAPGAVLDGDVLIEVGLPHQIDNMEGIAVSAHPRGHRVTLVSDDNRSLLQRTLLLEFLLAE